jgi:L-alanine-DL-glutamate epimerase-like enolase superfamily enzyme
MTWLEIDMHDPEGLAQVRRSSSTPITSLESLHGLRHYRPYFENQSVDVAVVDVPWNGVWESVRIATLAEAYEVACAPHNFYGHLASLMSAHFCASIPNFRIMEYEVDDVPWKDELVTIPPVVQNGELILPKGPGWGADVNEEALKAHPPRAPKR